MGKVRPKDTGATPVPYPSGLGCGWFFSLPLPQDLRSQGLLLVQGLNPKFQGSRSGNTSSRLAGGWVGYVDLVSSIP